MNIKRGKMADPLTTLNSLGDYESLGNLLGVSTTTAILLVIVVSIWILTWKGFALWKAASKKSIPWFIILLVFNTVGILEILYIFIFSKMSFKGKDKSKPEEKPKKKK